MLDKNPPLRVLLTNINLNGRSGTEIVTRDLALGLLRAGHRPAVYTQYAGPIAQELRAASIPVALSPEALEGEFDIIHGHHLVALSSVLARFPNTPAIFVCHDFMTWWDQPPRLPTIARYAAVSENLVERLTLECAVHPDLVDLVPNGVDLDRFALGPPPPARPRRALAFAKNHQHIEAIQSACAERKIALDIIGSAAGRIVEAPEAVMANYDLVFASALSALEAMACGRPTIVVDGRGVAGFVDEKRYGAWRPHNFGLKVLLHRPTKDLILTELDRYDQSAAIAVTKRVRADAGLDQWVAAYLRVYEKAIAAFAPPTPDAAARAWAKHLSTWSPRTGAEWPWMQEREQLIQQRDRGVSAIDVAPLDRALTFSAGGGAGEFIVQSGFSKFEAWGVWSADAAPSIRLRLPPSPHGLTLDFAYAAYVPAMDQPIEVTVLGNGAPIDRWAESGHVGWLGKTRSIAIPAELCTGFNVWLTFKTARAGSAIMRQPGAGEEKRFPGLGLVSMAFRRAPNA